MENSNKLKGEKMSKFESIIKANDIRLNEWYFGTLSVKGGLGICGKLLGEKGEVKECECCFIFYHSRAFGYDVRYCRMDSEGIILESDNRLVDCKVVRELDSEESSELYRLTAI